ncbi:uncharacterized protein LOC128983338 [Macrosteles quadrilineatus]|uniref:uncharacterized protein LOC128983338 n=1 Tax=Macrosteles quadrilineatus TaxID=74068 RepID=UPI0023E28E5B|nr:uncharacterized protein LOC128983338 [Macrosteles quadrilineatus]
MEKLEDYVVVEFISAPSVGTVLKSWLISPEKCYWPEGNIRKLLAKKEPPNSVWEVWDVRILGSSDSLLDAIHKEKLAQSTSDIGTDIEGGKKKRRITKPARILSSSSDSEKEDDLPIFDPSRKKATKKSPLKNKYSQGIQKNIHTQQRNTSSIHNFTSGHLTNTSPQIQNTPSTTSPQYLEDSYRQLTSPQQNQFVNQHPESSPSSTSKGRKSLFTPQIMSPRSTIDSALADSLEARLNKMQNQIDTMERTMLQTKVDVSTILEMLKEGQARRQPVEDISTIEKMFPLQQIEDVDNLEQLLLNDEEKSKQVKEYVRQIGGSSIEDATRRAFKKLFTNQLARQFSWEGKGGRKRSLNQLNIVQVVGREMRNGPFKHLFNLKAFEKTVSEWFRQSGTRIYVKNKNAQQIT